MTEKKLKRHLRRIWFHYDRLRNALNDAHNAEIIQYVDYQTSAPCKAMDDCRDRVISTTQKKIAELVTAEIRRGIR